VLEAVEVAELAPAQEEVEVEVEQVAGAAQGVALAQAEAGQVVVVAQVPVEAQAVGVDQEPEVAVVVVAQAAVVERGAVVPALVQAAGRAQEQVAREDPRAEIPVAAEQQQALAARVGVGRRPPEIPAEVPDRRAPARQPPVRVGGSPAAHQRVPRSAQHPRQQASVPRQPPRPLT
jgi:hypothetical protein